MGYENEKWSDVHGAGAHRSDAKTGDPADYPTGNGSQGDVPFGSTTTPAWCAMLTYKPKK